MIVWNLSVSTKALNEKICKELHEVLSKVWIKNYPPVGDTVIGTKQADRARGNESFEESSQRGLAARTTSPPVIGRWLLYELPTNPDPNRSAKVKK